MIGGCLLLAGMLPGRAEHVLAVLFGAGTMTLTLYSLHVALRTDLFWPDDTGTSAFAAHVLVVLWIGAVFAAAKRRGPIEEVLRRASSAATSRPIRKSGRLGGSA